MADAYEEVESPVEEVMNDDIIFESTEAELEKMAEKTIEEKSIPEITKTGPEEVLIVLFAIIASQLIIFRRRMFRIFTR